jgi:hypothetical protein
MPSETGRNTEQPEYLNEKDAAEDREGNTPGENGTDPNQKKREKDSVLSSLIPSAFGH